MNSFEAAHDRLAVRTWSRAVDAGPQPRSLESYREEMRKMAFDLACKVDMLARGREAITNRTVTVAPVSMQPLVEWQAKYEALAAKMMALYKEAGEIYPGEFI